MSFSSCWLPITCIAFCFDEASKALPWIPAFSTWAGCWAQDLTLEQPDQHSVHWCACIDENLARHVFAVSTFLSLCCSHHVFLVLVVFMLS